MKLISMSVFLSMAVAACAAQSGDEIASVEPAPVTASTINNGGGPATKKQSDLENDGYTCRHLEGTTLTLCWKGSSTYSCDEHGNCIEGLQRPPRPIFVAPPPTAVLAAP